MYIPCKSCGQQMYIPDDVKELTVCCPVCQTELVYSADTMANENVNISANSTAPVLGQTSPAEPLPEYATRESYHHARILKLQSFSSMDALLTTFRIISQHFGAMILILFVMALPYLVQTVAEFALIPDTKEVVAQSSVKLKKEGVSMETLNGLSKDYIDSLYASEDYNRKSFLLTAIFVLQIIVSSFIFIGCIRLFNAYGRNQKASLGLILSGFDSPVRVLFSTILFNLLTTFPFLLGIGLFMLGFSVIAVILCFAFSLFFSMFLYFMFALVADTNLSTIKSFQLSCLIAQRNILTLLGIVFLSFFILGLIGFILAALLSVMIPLVYIGDIGIPLVELVFVGLASVSYLKATGQLKEY